MSGEVSFTVNEPACECGNPSMVLVGPEKTPVCIGHFAAYLRNMRDMLDQAQKELDPEDT